MSLVVFRQGVSQIITDFFIYYWKVLCYIHDLNAYITGSSLSGLCYSEQGHLCAVADQSENMYTRPRWLNWVGYGIWSRALLSILVRIFSLNHKTLIKILTFILSLKTLKNYEEIGSKGSFIFVHSWSWCLLFVYFC